MINILEISQLAKRYGGLLATDHVSLTLAPGELHAIIGPNGAGKTTLIGQLGGEVTPDSGSIRFDGKDITSLAPARPGAAWPCPFVSDHLGIPGAERPGERGAGHAGTLRAQLRFLDADAAAA